VPRDPVTLYSSVTKFRIQEVDNVTFEHRSLRYLGEYAYLTGTFNIANFAFDIVDAVFEFGLEHETGYPFGEIRNLRQFV